MTENLAKVSQGFQKHGWLKKHLSLNHVKAKPFVDQLGYLAVADYDLQNYAGMLSWHTGSEMLGYLLRC
jgi:hypothetical protein